LITHDSRFEELAKAPVKQTDVVVTRRVLDEFGDMNDDGIVSWTSSDVLMDVTIDAVGEMLGVATKKAVAKIIGIIDTVAPGNLMQVRLSIMDTDTDTWNTISVGHFLVDSVDYNYDAGSTTITMYDHMWKASNTLYTEAVGLDFISYPITVQDFAGVMANLLNVELDPNFADLPNSQYLILEDLYSNISTATLKNAIQDIAGATGTTAHMTDTTLDFRPFEPLSENLDSAELKTLKISETYGPITSLVLGRVPQNDNVAIAANAPADNVITGVDTSTDQFTLVNHSMPTGNLIRLQTTGAFPLPIAANVNYYINTIDADTFTLHPTYADALAGTNIVDITTAGSGDLMVPTLTNREIQINNNEILDDAREDLIGPLYNVLSGIDWTDVKADTVGLGWHEVGDVISFTQGLNTVRAFLAEVHMTLAGSIKEQLVSKVPDVQSINYAAAGGIAKTIYNTEIKVDKQAQEITSVVSRQDTLEGVVNEQFTSIEQDVDDVLITIQRAGGGNILYNSVGFAKETFRDTADISYDKLLYWEYPDPYTISSVGRTTSYSSSDSQAAGGISGQVIEMSGSSMYIKQRVTIGAGVPLCFAFRVNNTIGTGSGTFTISNDLDSWVITVPDTATFNWTEVKFEDFQSRMPWLDIEVQVTDAQKFMFTDLRLMYGSTTQGWVQANGEILSANVQFTTDGVRVFDSVHDTETRVSYNEFSTRRKSDGTVLFEADDLGIVTGNLSINGRTSYIRDGDTIIKQITVGSSNPKAGLAFIRAVE